MTVRELLINLCLDVGRTREQAHGDVLRYLEEYPDCWGCLENEFPPEDAATLRELAKAEFAKRQRN